MKFTVIAVGKLKERFWSDACSEYLKRLQPYAKTKVVEIADVDPARVGGEAASIEREGASILKAIPERAHVVLLAIDGKQRSSEGLSQRIDDLGLGGMGEIVFVIGEDWQGSTVSSSSASASASSSSASSGSA